MSNAIEAIIYRSLLNKEDDGFNESYILTSESTAALALNLRKYKFKNYLDILMHVSRTFDERFIDVALKLSLENIHNVLLISYDDRVGHRYSCIYRQGDLIKEFANEDEIWVLVDDNYEPILDRKFSPSQVAADDSEDREYQALDNSIQLGINEIGIQETWKEIFQLLCSMNR